jgi:hypothetical protein
VLYVKQKERDMEKVCQFAVKVIIDRAEHMNKKKIVDALEKAIENLMSKDVTLKEVKKNNNIINL